MDSPSRAATARVAAAAGLFSSCASPAASVPRVTSAPRCRAVDSTDRAVRYTPADEMSAEREPGSRSRHARQREGTLNSSARNDSPAGGQVDAVLVPGAEAPSPTTGLVHPGDHGVLTTDVADEIDLRRRREATSCRPDRPHGTGPGRVRCATSEPLSISSVSWSSVSPVEDRSAGADPRRASDRCQVAVHEVDRHRSLAHRRRHPLHRVEPDVTGREDAGHTRLPARTVLGPASTWRPGRERRAGPAP